MTGRRVRVTYQRSRGVSTDPDLTGRVRLPFEGELLELAIGAPLQVVRLLRNVSRLLRTTPVDHIERADSLAEVTTRRSVYRVRFLDDEGESRGQ